jgi:ribose 1,5-bisphosphokinase PhnN
VLVLVLVLVLHPKTIRLGTSCASRCVVKVICGGGKTCTLHDYERVKSRDHCKIQGNVAVTRVCHALSYGAMPSRLDMWILHRFSIVRGWSRHDLAMTREWCASVVCVLRCVGDYRPKSEVHTASSD